jgi:hypothetical protein
MTYYSNLLSGFLFTVFLGFILISCQSQENSDTSGDQDVKENNPTQTQTVSEQPDPELTEKEIEKLIKQHVTEKHPETNKRRRPAYWKGCSSKSKFWDVGISSEEWIDDERVKVRGHVVIFCEGYSDAPDEQILTYIINRDSGDWEIRAEPPVPDQIYR